MTAPAVTIWIDNDACPAKIRDVVFKAGHRTQTPIVVVANRHMGTSPPTGVQMIVVSQGPDVADDYIAEHIQAGDLVVTADVPLADRVVKADGVAISMRGKIFDEESIGDALAVRNLKQELLGSGLTGGGPPPFSANDVQRFANAFDRELTRARRGH